MARPKKKTAAADMGAGKTSDIDDFLKEFKDAVVDTNAEAEGFKEGWLSTGSIAIDRRLGGGLRRGFISELYGAPYGGKTTIALAVASRVLKSGGRVLFMDTEGALDIGRPEGNIAEPPGDDKAQKQAETRAWLAKNGVNPFDPNFHLTWPYTGQEIYQMVYRGVTNRLFDLIVLDSMAGVVTAKEMSDVELGKFDAANYGAVANLNSKSLKVIVKVLRRQGFTHFMIINQQRDVINHMGVGGKKSTGGNALEHYVRQRARINRYQKGAPAFEGSTELVTKVYFKLEKSSFSPAPTETAFQISSERGVDTPHEVLQYALQTGYAAKSGQWVYFYNRPVVFKELRATGSETEVEEGYLGKVNGEGRAKHWLLAQAGLFSKLYDQAVQTINSQDGREGGEDAYGEDTGEEPVREG